MLGAAPRCSSARGRAARSERLQHLDVLGEQPLQELGGNGGGRGAYGMHGGPGGAHRSQLGRGMAPAFDMGFAGGQGMRKRDGNLLSGLGKSLAGEIGRSIPIPQNSIAGPRRADVLSKGDQMSNFHSAMPGTTTRRRPGGNIF